MNIEVIVFSKISNLHSWLKLSGLTEETKRLEAIFKKAFINNAYIAIEDTGSSRVLFHLMGTVKDNYHKFGTVLIYEIDGANEPFTNLWHIHAPGFDYEYLKLGYGRDLYLTAIKYVTELGGFIISGPISDSTRSKLSLDLHKKLKTLPGIESNDVFIVESEEDMIIKHLTDDVRLLINDLGHSSDDLELYGKKVTGSDDLSAAEATYLLFDHIYDFKGKGMPEERIADLLDYRQELADEIEYAWGDVDEDTEQQLELVDKELDTYNIPFDTSISVGTLIRASGNLPISLPVKNFEGAAMNKWEQENPKPAVDPDVPYWKETDETRNWHNQRNVQRRQYYDEFQDRRKQVKDIREIEDEQDDFPQDDFPETY